MPYSLMMVGLGGVITLVGFVCVIVALIFGSRSFHKPFNDKASENWFGIHVMGMLIIAVGFLLALAGGFFFGLQVLIQSLAR